MEKTPFTDHTKAASAIPVLVAKVARDTGYEKNLVHSASVNSSTGTVIVTCDQHTRASSLNVYFASMSNIVNQTFGLRDSPLSLFQLASTSVNVTLDCVPLDAISTDNPKDLCTEMQNIITLDYGVMVNATRFLIPDRKARLSNPNGTTRLRGTIIVSIPHNEVEKLGTTISIFSSHVKVCKLWQVTSATLCKNCFEYSHHTTNCNLKPRCDMCTGQHPTKGHRCGNINCTGHKTFKRNYCPLDKVLVACVSCVQNHCSSDPSCPTRAAKNSLAKEAATAGREKRVQSPLMQEMD